MEERTTGIVLRLHPLTETSWIVRWLSRDLGRLSTVAKGARNPKSVYRGKLDLYFHLDFSFHRSRHSDLHTLRELRLLHTFPKLRVDWQRLNLVAYASSLIEAATEIDTPLETAYGLLLSYIQGVSQLPPLPILLLAFEVKWMRELGIMPDLDQAQISPDTRQYLRTLSFEDWATAARLVPRVQQAEAINIFIQNCLQHQMDRLPANRSQVLASWLRGTQHS
jgi:DNA repair protein RecO (recombination protein O)